MPQAPAAVPVSLSTSQLASYSGHLVPHATEELGDCDADDVTGHGEALTLDEMHAGVLLQGNTDELASSINDACEVRAATIGCCGLPPLHSTMCVATAKDGEAGSTLPRLDVTRSLIIDSADAPHLLTLEPSAQPLKSPCRPTQLLPPLSLPVCGAPCGATISYPSTGTNTV